MDTKAPAADPTRTWPTCPQLACAWGEVLDRWTILRLKMDRIAAPEQRRNVARELAMVDHVIGDINRFPSGLAELVNELANVNTALWDIEDGKRACEKNKRFDADFIELARAVYRENDRRARIKKRINLLLGSDLLEEKSHATVG